MTVDDTISRRAAIDEIDSLYFDTVDDHDRTKERIKRLPSAQPDVPDINVGDMISRLEKDDFGTLAICAIRYCHGRQTYMPDLVRSIVRPRLKELSDKDLNVMIEDCDFQERMNLYGDKRIDKPGWLRWKADLIAERERRTDGR